VGGETNVVVELDVGVLNEGEEIGELGVKSVQIWRKWAREVTYALFVGPAACFGWCGVGHVECCLVLVYGDVGWGSSANGKSW
jgi:hypothetical protein